MKAPESRLSLAEGGRDLREWLLTRNLTDLQRKLEVKQQETRNLECQLAAYMAHGDRGAELPAVVTEVIGRVVAVTERLFSGPVTVEHMCDPDVPQHAWLVFNCPVDLPISEVREKKFEWYDEVAKIVPGALDQFRIYLVPQP